MPGRFIPPQNRSAPSPAIPPGTIVVEVFDERQRPVTDAKVTLQTNFQSIAQGNSDARQVLQVDEKGHATFSDLETALRFSYVVEVTRNGAKYQIPDFRLGKTGHRVIVHTYDTTHDEFEALVAASGMTQVSLREDFFRVDVMYRVINLSDKAWLPQNIKLNLPKNATALDTQARSGDAGFKELEQGGLQVVGTYPPGHQDIQFSFQIPNENKESIAFDLSIPFHLLEYVVIAEEAPGMTLTVPGFDEAQSRPGQDGKDILFVHRNLRREGTKLNRVTVELGGLPVIGPGRWIAALLALAIALAGLVFGIRSKSSTARSPEEIDKARGILLDEMKVLEGALERGDVGPRTYEQTKREILTALARLEPQASHK